MECRYCKKSIDKKWNYCPNCGKNIEKNSLFPNLLDGYLRKLRDFFLRNYRKKQGKPFDELVVDISQNDDFLFFSESCMELSPYSERDHMKMSANIIEPETEIKNSLNILHVNIMLPGVKSENDILISKLTSSIELRAFAKDKRYFKIIKIPESTNLLEKKFENGMLTLKFSNLCF